MDKKKCTAHCGFPEKALGRQLGQLMQQGCKVARIEQTETNEMRTERMANTPGKKDRNVRRELCRIITPATQTYSYLEGDDSSVFPKLLLSVCEKSEDDKRRYGVTFVDCAVGKVWMSEFDDDNQCSRLRTMLAQYPPSEVLYTRKRITTATEAVLDGLHGCQLERIAWKSQFLTATDTLKKIITKEYFVGKDENASKTANVDVWPPELKNVLADGDCLGATCKSSYELCVSSLGAIIWYLEKCLIDYDVLTLKLFEWYEPPAVSNSEEAAVASSRVVPPLSAKTLILDAAALKNLDVLQSSSKPNSVDGTLLELLDSCSTAFGKRLLRHWLCNPLCQVDRIAERQQGVSALLEHYEFAEIATSLLKEMPDLERLLQKVHTLGSTKRLDHPDNRAVFFEGNIYNKRKVEEFLTTLDGLQKALDIAEAFGNISNVVDSTLLKSCLTTTGCEKGRFPDLRHHLSEIKSKFDLNRAKNEGVVIATADLAAINETRREITDQFDAYLQEQKKKLDCKKIQYAEGKKNRYLLEVPEELSSRVKNDYKYVGKIKGWQRFITDRIEELLDALQNADDQREATYRDSMRRVFELFSDKSEIWRCVVDCMATVDVLLSLSRYAHNAEQTMCIPKVCHVTGNEKPFIEIVNGCHPCASKIYTMVDQFVPNDTVIGTGSTLPSVLLLTGPNMGGKSTLMRQVASLVILAQIGSHVPAEACSLSVVDRIFTRLGACDRLSAGQSTFGVELTETNMILRHATIHSLVVIDELGRGTATHDGAAIAHAVLNHLAASSLGPRSLFSTHYHSLVDRLKNHPNIALGHMACTVESESVDDPTEETITFLYKLSPGPCPKSYGFNAAKLAGIPDKIVKRAYSKAGEAESMLQLAQRVRYLMNGCRTMTDEELVSKLSNLL